MIDPKIYLLQDTCFAIKRWVEPETWGPVIKNIGFDSVEASFDNEMDLFYTPKWYRDDWFDRVKKIEKKEGIKVRSFFTGYQTYRTTGLSHPNPRIADYLFDGWLKPAVQELGERGLDLGFALNSFPDNVLQTPEAYQKAKDTVIRYMAKIGRLGADTNSDMLICTEAMYTPSTIPWTIEDSEEILKKIYQTGGDPVYITIDLGHMIGQRRFFKPTEDEISEKLAQAISGEKIAEPWLGADHTYQIWDKAIANKDTSDAVVLKILNDMDHYQYLFSKTKNDINPYAWLKKLGCYSPIMHMQQTNGKASSHAAFTEESNKDGIIKGKAFFEAIAEAYRQPDAEGMPPKTDRINLAFEIFASNLEHPREIIEKLKETSAYWKQFVPEDGMRLSEILKRIQ